MSTMQGSFVRLEGQWTQARSRFRGLAIRMNLAAEVGMGGDAKALAYRIRHNILSRNYETHWPPLADSTRAEKHDSRTLVETQSYVNSIVPIHMGGGRWSVGIREGDHKNVEKAFTHEFGSAPGKKPSVPARPHFRPEVERYLAGGARKLRIADAMADVLAGKVVRRFDDGGGEDE